MFVQIIKGSTSDAEGIRRRFDAWLSDIKPGAVGYLGSTGGVAPDGTAIMLARFESAEAAQANSERAEQGTWWAETAKHFDGDPTFRESTDTSTLFDGGSNNAGFVQIMEGKVLDRVKADSFETPEMLAQLRSARPDLVGALRVWLEGGAFVEAAYFTSEQAARGGETSAEFAGPQADYIALFGEMTFIDLPAPLLD